MECQVDVDKGYIRLWAKKGMKFALDPCKQGMVDEYSRLESLSAPLVGDVLSSPIVDLTMDYVGAAERMVLDEPEVRLSTVDATKIPPAP